MDIRPIAMRTALLVLLSAPGFALAAGGGGDHWRLHSTRPTLTEQGARMQLHGMMRQMGGMLEHMAARLQTGSLTSEQTKQMSEVMRHIAEMMNTLYGMRGEETPQQMLNMLEQMTDMHKRLMVVLAGPEPGTK
ncbi:MAG: hypothetical protein AB7N91_10590 [Candidatus Tectimicrobiota bacterium]